METTRQWIRNNCPMLVQFMEEHDFNLDGLCETIDRDFMRRPFRPHKGIHISDKIQEGSYCIKCGMMINGTFCSHCNGTCDCYRQ